MTWFFAFGASAHVAFLTGPLNLQSGASCSVCSLGVLLSHVLLRCHTPYTSDSLPVRLDLVALETAPLPICCLRFWTSLYLAPAGMSMKLSHELHAILVLVGFDEGQVC